MKQIFFLLLGLCSLTGICAQVRVTDFRAVPDVVSSGQMFTFHATVLNNSGADVHTEIFLRGMSDPEKGFFDLQEFPVARYSVDMNATTLSKDITYEYSITTEDEFFSFFWRDAQNNIISDRITVQIGNCGSEVERVEFPMLNTYVFVDSISNIFVAVYPESAPRDVKWIIGDPSLAKIIKHYYDGNCPAIIFKGLAPGETTLTARAPNGIEATIPLTVYKNRKPATSLTLNITEFAGDVGDSFQLVPTIEPDDVDDPLVYYVSRDDKVATVDIFEGLVVLVGPGSTEIVAWVSPGGAQTSCQVMAEPVSSVEDGAVDDRADVFGIDGMFILRQASREAIDALPAGFYILRFPTFTRKIAK